MQRDDQSFEEVYEAGRQETAEQETAESAASVLCEGIQPDPEAVRRASERLVAAEALVATADEGFGVAEDELADAEGAVAVAEFKAEDLEADESLKQWQKAAAREELARARRRYRRAVEKVGQCEQRHAAAEAEVRKAAAQLRTAEETPSPAEEPPALRFASLPLFVTYYVLPNWVHRMGEAYGGSWCSRWWEHPEAVTRLEAVWEAFEVMRLQPPPSLSTWLRDHFDPHMRALTLPYGPFYRCAAEDHRTVHELVPAWPAEPTPEGMFSVNPDAMIQQLENGAGQRADTDASNDRHDINGTDSRRNVDGRHNGDDIRARTDGMVGRGGQSR